MSDAEPEIRFEAALAQLEEIVDALQRGEPELSTALAKYEQGVELLGRCYGLLERAERSVAILTGVDDEGRAVTAPFDAAATLAETVAATTAATAKPKAAPKRRRTARTEPEREREPSPDARVEPTPLSEPELEYDRFDPPF